jgi:hypothetical protein
MKSAMYAPTPKPSTAAILESMMTKKVILVTGRGGPHFLNNRLTDGGEAVSFTRRLLFTPQEDSWYSLLLEAESTPGP